MKKFYITIITLFTLNCHPLYSQFTNVLIDNAFHPEEPSISINLLNPDLMAAGSNVQNVYYSFDGGATWITTFINSSFGDAGDPCFGADSTGNFFYFHLANGIDRIVCQKSDDGGFSYYDGSYAWNNNSLLQDKEWAAVDPATGNLYVTWTEYDNGFSPGPQDSSRILFSKSTDQGLTFTTPVKINEISGDCLYLDITDPHPIVGLNADVYVTFMDSAGIRINKSVDSGNTWLTSPLLIENTGAFRYNSIPGVSRIRTMPYSACDRSNSAYRGNLYVSWADQRNGLTNSDVFFIKSTDGGNTWTSAMKINSDNSNNHQFRNAMAVDQTNGYIYIVYYDRRNYPNNDSTDVYLSKSLDGGDTWIEYKISSNGFYSDGSVFDGDYIDIAAHAGVVRPIWTAIDNFTPGVWTCLYNESTVGIPLVNDQKIEFTVNPNPADVISVISFSHEIQNTMVVITDASGRIIKTFEVSHETEKIIDLHDFASGVYFIRAGSLTKKLIIEK